MELMYVTKKFESEISLAKALVIKFSEVYKVLE
jgi:hypothetical protein